MALITHTLASLPNTRDMDGVTIASWTPTTLDADTFSAVQCPSARSKSVQVTGVFNGATLALQGSNDGTNYAALLDLSGNAVSFTAAGLKSIAPSVRYIKPATSSAGASTSLTVTLLVKV